MKEFLAHLGKRIVVQRTIKPMVGKFGTGNLDARDRFLLGKRPGIL